MKINLLTVLPATAAVVDDASTLLSLATTESSTAANLLKAVGHRNVTAMEALVQELAQESLNAPTDGGYHSFSADITLALKTIKNMFVKSIQDALQDEHKADQEHFNCFTRDCFGKCITDYDNELKTCDKQDCSPKAEEHEKCRKTVYEKYHVMADACAELHCFVPYNHKHTGKHICAKDYCLCHDLTNCQYDGVYSERNRNRQAKTAKDKLENKYYDLAWLTGDFSWQDDYTNRSYDKDTNHLDNVCKDSDTNGPTECHKEKFGSWLLSEIKVYEDEYKRWEGLWDKCSEAYKDFMKEDTSCDAKQQEFEKCLCTKNACERNACNVDYDRCEAECWDRYKDLVDDKECLEKNRKIDWSATKKIECYLDVLLHDYTNKTLIEECKGENCINKIREEKYKKCAGICIEVDHEGVWPEATGSWPDQAWPQSFTLHDRRSKKADDPNGFHLGDTNVMLPKEKRLYECDDNGDIVFTKHRGGSAETREDEKRCTEHLDIDYQIPRCTPCRPEPEPVCDEVFHQKWYSQFDDVSFNQSVTGKECSNDNGENGCFAPKELQSSSDGITFTTLVVKEHSYAWAYNRCNCQHCTDSAPVYPKRPDGMQCGMGAHTISPAIKAPAAVVTPDLEIGETGPASFTVDSMCVQRITLTHLDGLVSCQTQDLWGDAYVKNAGGKFKMNGTINDNKRMVWDIATKKLVDYKYAAKFDNEVKTSSSSFWGCQGQALGLIVSDAQDRVRAPVFDTTVGLQPMFTKSSHTYQMDGVDHASTKMSWTFEQPLRFDGDYKLWYNEALTASYTKFGKASYSIALEPSASTTCRPAPMQFTNVCTKTKGPGKHEKSNIKVPANTKVCEIAVHWTSGYLSCRKHVSGASRFGCGSQDGGQSIALVWTEGNSKTKVLGKTADWQNVEAGVGKFDVHSERTLSMKSTTSFTVQGSEGLDLWYTEDLRDESEHDNHGVACYDVSVHPC